MLQADYILELQLRRLTRFSRIELEAERDKLRAEIAELEALLADPARIRALVGDELDEVAERFGTPRRTLLTEAHASIATVGARKAGPAASLEIADVPTLRRSCRRPVAPCGSICRTEPRRRSPRRGAASTTRSSRR